MAAEHGIGAPPREAVLHDIAAAHVLEEDDYRERGIVDLLFQLGFALRHAHATGLELVDDPVAAAEPHGVKDQPLVGRIEYDLELRVLLDRALIQKAVGDVPVLLDPGCADGVLAIGEQPFGPLGRQVWRREDRLPELHPRSGRTDLVGGLCREPADPGDDDRDAGETHAPVSLATAPRPGNRL